MVIIEIIFKARRNLLTVKINTKEEINAGKINKKNLVLLKGSL